MRCRLSILVAAGCLALLAGCDSDEGPNASEDAPIVTTVVERIDLNSASVAELETLPGIGEVMAQRIIDGRPYDSVEAVLNVDGVGEGTLTKIRELVLAK